MKITVCLSSILISMLCLGQSKITEVAGMLNPNLGSDPIFSFSDGTYAYFYLSGLHAGYWRTDGTLNGTTYFSPFSNFLFSKIGNRVLGYNFSLNDQGADHQSIPGLKPGLTLGNFYYFVDSGGIYRTDGTAANTQRILEDAHQLLGIWQGQILFERKNYAAGSKTFLGFNPDSLTTQVWLNVGYNDSLQLVQDASTLYVAFRSWSTANLLSAQANDTSLTPLWQGTSYSFELLGVMNGLVFLTHDNTLSRFNGIEPEPISSEGGQIFNWTQFGNLAYFYLYGTSYGFWKTDGTPEGTERILSAGNNPIFKGQTRLWFTDGEMTYFLDRLCHVKVFVC